MSPTGSDSNNCSLAAPCRNFQAAYAQTNAGGEIAVLGTAGYNNGATFTINKAISIVNPGGFEAGIAVPSGGIGIVINAGVNDALSLRGLTMEGGGVGNTGIIFNTGASLTIENSVIRHLTATGIYFGSNVPISLTSSLSVSNTLVADNSGTGIYIIPTGSGTVTAVFNRVQTNNNLNYGIVADGANSTGTVKATISDSLASNNGGQGFYAVTDSSHAPTTLMVVRSVAANNLYGLYAAGTGATLRVANSTVTGNGNGWLAIAGGVLDSYGDSYIDGNGGLEAAPPTIVRK